MNTFRYFFVLLLISFAGTCFGQSKTETFKVAGECGMCKKKIENAAKLAGASFAEWNTESKLLTVKIAGTATREKIEESIAGAGYDTPGVKASDKAYKNLDECCQYERTATK